MSEHPRIRLLRYIAENQPASVKGMTEYTGMSIGSIYHHLSNLEGLIVQNRSKKYLITEYGINYLKSEEAKLDIMVKPLETETSVDMTMGSKRRAILELIAEKGLASVKEMRSLKISVGSLYHHLYTLMQEGLVAQSANRKYALTVKSFQILKSGTLQLHIASNKNLQQNADERIISLEIILTHVRNPPEFGYRQLGIGHRKRFPIYTFYEAFGFCEG